MKVFYHCEECGAAIASIEVAYLDEAKFGFDCLTDEERRDIIKFDASGAMHVQSVCDACAVRENLDEDMPVFSGKAVWTVH